MERTMSVEDKIKRAEEIYARRHEENNKKVATVSINEDKRERKDIKLLKKMIIQIVVSFIIYLIVFEINSHNFIFSEDFLKEVNNILSYDINFSQMYQNIKNNVSNGIMNMKKNTNNLNEENINNLENNSESQINKVENNNQDGAIGGSNEENQTGISTQENARELTQEEKDIATIKNTTTFIKPVEGTISSKYGQRNPTTQTVPKNHTGIDIAANNGTKIRSATDGEVILASEEGDYGKHLKVKVGDVIIVYAHCNNLYVKQGDKVYQGQEIAEVGSTGNSTGPHLHFEIRLQERTINPEKIITF